MEKVKRIRSKQRKYLAPAFFIYNGNFYMLENETKDRVTGINRLPIIGIPTKVIVSKNNVRILPKNSVLAVIYHKALERLKNGTEQLSNSKDEKEIEKIKWVNINLLEQIKEIENIIKLNHKF